MKYSLVDETIQSVRPSLKTLYQQLDEGEIAEVLWNRGNAVTKGQLSERFIRQAIEVSDLTIVDNYEIECGYWLTFVKRSVK